MIVAGGGTGGVTVFNGEQLNHTNGEVIYLDFSLASMKIAHKRARVRRLQNVIWVRSWLEGISYLGIGVFDQSQCSGVLHHLKNPRFGLNILKDSLTTYGGMQLMVYAIHGRTAVYQIQNLLKIINKDQHGIEGELINTNHTLNILPRNNWFVVTPLHRDLGDHKVSYSGIYDLLLYARDQAFSILDLHQWIAKGGLYFVDYDTFKSRYQLNIQYTIYDDILYRKVADLDVIKQWSIMEIMRCDIVKHGIFASKAKNSVAILTDPSTKIYMYGNPYGFKEALSSKKNRRIFGNQTFVFVLMSQMYLNPTVIDSNIMPYNRDTGIKGTDEVKFALELNKFNIFLLNRLVDSNRGITLKTIYSEYRKESNFNISNYDLYKLVKDFYTSVKDTGMFLLRKKHVTLFPKTAFMHLFNIKSI